MTRTLPLSARIRLLLASILAAALTVGLLAVAPATVYADETESVSITEGNLTWGIRDSWRSYTMGRATVSEGATLDATNTFTLPAREGTYDPATGATTIGFDGVVHYEHHCGNIYVWTECALDLKIQGFRVVISQSEQVLYATVASRPKAVGDAPVAPAIIEYGEIPFANLDIREATVTTDAGVTTWSGVRAYMTAEGSPAIEYAPGTVLSPLTFSYTGPGGKPDMEERWTEPGTRSVVETARWVADDVDYRQRGAAQSLFVNDDNAAVHVVSNAVDTGVRLQSHDPATLEPIASYNKQTDGVGPVRAFDPERGALFLSERTGPVESLYAFSLDGDTYRKELITEHTTGDVVMGIWDDHAHRLLLLVSDFSGAEPTVVLEAWSRDGDESADWVRERFALPAPPASYPYDAFSYYFLNNLAQSMVVLSDGSLMMGRWEQANRLVFTGDTIELAEVIDSPALSFGYDGMVAGPSGEVWFYSGSQFVQFRLQDDGTLQQSSELITGTDTLYQWGAVDPVSGVLWAKSQAISELIAVEPGGVVFRQQYDDFSRYPQVAVGSDQIVYSALRNTQLNLGVARFEQVGVSPTVTEHPQSQTVRLEDVTGTTELTLSAEAVGDPDPEVQWQRRAAGASGFVAVPGEQGATLTIAAASADNGVAYRAVFTNPAGAIASDAAVITVETLPTVAVQPTSTSVGVGGTVTFYAMPAGNPTPEVAWQVNTGTGWEDVTPGPAATPDGGYLTLTDVGADQNGWGYRARLSNSVGVTYSDVATLTVTNDSVVPVPQEDGSIVGVKNPYGAYTQIKPGVDVPTSGEGVTVEVTGRGFTQNTNTAGVYALFGYLVNPPSSGASAGNGYDFNPGGGVSGQEGQLFIAWPSNGQTGGAAHGRFSSTRDGSFTAAGLVAQPRFTGQSGAAVDCLDGSVVCGVLTIGAHGGADPALETFTPVYFDGQDIPVGPVDPPVPPVIDPPTPPTAPTVAPSREGSLLWGVKSSFRSYITGNIAKGAISVREGAAAQRSGFWFGQSSTDWNKSTGRGSTAYRGAVNFTGHSGVLNLTFANPVVRIDSATGGVLLVTVNGNQVAIGNLDLGAASRSEESGGVAYSNVPVSLTAAGVGVFSYGSSQFYPAGTALDPISFVVGVASTSAPATVQTVAAHTSTAWTAPAEPPANSGIWIDPERLKSLRPGTEITATADGFEPNEAGIKVVLYSDPVVLEQNLIADANGEATWTGIIPPDIEPGQHTLTFQGSVSRGIEITVLDAAALEGCTVAGASLEWGFKESFRSYISGSIAHGEWQVSDGATYETPLFGWTGGAGTFDADVFTGQVSFTGTLRFTGHDGLLDTTIANPTLLFTGPETAYLLLDVAGVTMEDALAGNTGTPLRFDQVPFVELDLSAGTVEVSDDGTQITATGVPTAITSQGYEAFPNYEAGTVFDPISFEITTETGCALAPLDEDEALADDPTVEPISDERSDTVWLWWTGGGLLAAAVIAAVVIWLIRRRRDEDSTQGQDETTPVDGLLGGGR